VSDVTTPGACAGSYVRTITYEASDDCGNTNATQYEVVITVTDDTAPEWDQSPGALDESYDCSDTISWSEPTATDDCSEADVTEVSDVTTPGACAGSYVRTITYEASDDCGNTNPMQYEVVITVTDTTDPVFTHCPDDVTVECDASTEPGDTGGPATATDDCGTPTVTYSDVSDTGTITRTWTAEDACGNTETCVQVITVEDNTDPVFIHCPDDVTVECDASTEPGDTGGPATATDNCDPSPIVTYSDSASGSCPVVITRTWTAEDDAGNTETCVQVITVEDTTAPVLSVPADVTVECGGSMDPSSTGQATATDNCDPSPIVTYTDSPDGSCPAVITRTWTATDACQNSVSGAQTITVESAAPIPTPPPGGGGFAFYVGNPCPETFTVDFLGEITEVPMTPYGTLCEDCYAPSPDEMHLLELEEGTRVLDNLGGIVTLIEVTEVEVPLLPPYTELVGSAYDFAPSDITFDPGPAIITLGYYVSELPEDALTVSMAFYVGEAGWTPLEGESSQVAEIGSETAETSHWTIFAVLAEVPLAQPIPEPIPEPTPDPPQVASFEVSNLVITGSRHEIWGFPTFVATKGENAEISVDVANTGNHEGSYAVSLEINGELRDTQEITLAPGQTEQVVFTINDNDRGHFLVVVGDLSAEFSSSLWINWWLIGGILGALAVIGSVAVWMRRKLSV
ncbi:hypothetical protein ACFLST_01575, partial [Chloroflexota bacterium]